MFWIVKSASLFCFYYNLRNSIIPAMRDGNEYACCFVSICFECWSTVFIIQYFDMFKAQFADSSSRCLCECLFCCEPSCKKFYLSVFILELVPYFLFFFFFYSFNEMFFFFLIFFFFLFFIFTLLSSIY